MRIKLLTALAIGLLLGACSAAKPQRPLQAGGRVTIKTFMFTPSLLRVKVGQTVTWSNQDQIQHTATSGVPRSSTGVFDGAMDGQGRTFRFTFMVAGTYPYFCSRHNGMRGKIVVVP